MAEESVSETLDRSPPSQSPATPMSSSSSFLSLSPTFADPFLSCSGSFSGLNAMPLNLSILLDYGCRTTEEDCDPSISASRHGSRLPSLSRITLGPAPSSVPLLFIVEAAKKVLKTHETCSRPRLVGIMRSSE